MNAPATAPAGSDHQPSSGRDAWPAVWPAAGDCGCPAAAVDFPAAAAALTRIVSVTLRMTVFRTRSRCSHGPAAARNSVTSPVVCHAMAAMLPRRPWRRHLIYAP
jgi:hypothetical protein